ncbi:mariner Mos1 transposase [Trichonephila clavipes]|uniref:Mariner Mos1 transposase n=1 Tax=Trichonephila clavipes TaxID=2585209 RepID=A0A8X6R943_TRICX|nr:mariner Mos1 transposase [Trichonephila clavipes]
MLSFWFAIFNVPESRKKLTNVYGEGVLTVRQCQNWFVKFRFGNFDVEDAPRSGRPVDADKDAIKLLPDNTTIDSEIYCHQLDKLNDALQQKRSELTNRKGVVFHQDNARPHTSLVTHQKLLQLEWDTMPHPQYSPDLAPSDYYLFRSLQNFLDGKTFTSNEEVKNHLDQFFASKNQKFYEREIMLLPERYQKTSTVHNFWPILQILDGASAVCQDPDTVLIRVESLIESTTNSNDFRSKDGTVVRIPDADFNIVPRSVTKNNIPCSTRIRTTTICVNNQSLIRYMSFITSSAFCLSNSGWLLCLGVLVNNSSRNST